MVNLWRHVRPVRYYDAEASGLRDRSVAHGNGIHVKAADIGVITPYKAMAHLLQSKLHHAAACQHIKVDTVDASQGQETQVS